MTSATWVDWLGERQGRHGEPEPIVASAIWTGLDVFRPLAVVYAVYLTIPRVGEMARPWVAALVLGALAAYSVALLAVRRRTARLMVIEVVLASCAILATRLADRPDTIAAGAPTLSSIWPAGTVVGAGVMFGVLGGLAVAGVLSIADLVEIGAPTTETTHNVVLLVLLGGLFGMASQLARLSEERLVTALAEQERLRERERLSRAVHDGVLQTLALIHRRAADLGGQATELAQLAADQEVALRRLVTGSLGELPRSGQVDLGVLLASLEAPDVTVIRPAHAVMIDASAAEAVRDAVAAALDNVSRHAGAGASAWVLLETAEQRMVRVTVRDNGQGCPPEAVAAAVAHGRMGVSRSIRGRIEDLGGSARWESRTSGGCTVVMEIPDLVSHRERS